MRTSGIRDVSTAVGSNSRAEPRGLVAALTIVSHPFAHRVGERCLLDAVATGRDVALSRNSPDFFRPGSSIGTPLADPFVSRRPIRIGASGRGGIRLVVGAGCAVAIAGASIEDEVEIAGEDVANGVVLEIAGRVAVLLHRFEPAERDPDPLGMLGDSAGLGRVRTAIRRVADLDVPVLIRGETGTGKELVARAIHQGGPHRRAPFVSVNLGAIPRELAAAELFGARRGAYTGATRDREGLFRAAHGGTLFLDEVAEASPEVQAMLLRVLETGELYPVGADAPVATQVRVIAATDADLDDHIRQGRFKAPLLHRLAGYEVRVPALRERRDDIGVLFHHFAREELAAIGELHRLSPRDPYATPWISAAHAAWLVRQPWPGNIRQLRNATRQLVIGSRGLPQLRLDPLIDAPEATAASAEVQPSTPQPAPPRPAAARRKPSEVGEPELLDALRASAWDLKAAADRLRIPRPSIYDLIERSPNVRTAGDLRADEIAAAFRASHGDLDAMVAQLQVSKRALQRRMRELGLAADRARPSTRSRKT